MKRIIFLITYLTFSLLLADGMFTVGRSGTPVIDGKADDECWRKAIAVTPFILRNEARFAREQTTVKFSYDENNLYVLFRCEASCLDPVNNLLHEFRCNASANDDPAIYQDDAVILLLQPMGSKNVYEFVVNGQGALLDAVCTPPNLWQVRNPGWNSGTRAAATQENGYWCAEMSIPFQALGGQPKPHNKWQFMVGRIEQRHRETSSWQNLRSGFHDLRDFGQMVFSASAPSVELQKMPEFRPGKNRLELAARGVKIHPIVTFAGEAAQEFPSSAFSLDKAGNFTFKWKLTNSSGNATWMITPEYQMSVQASELIFDNTNSVKLNDQAVQSGAILGGGKNILEVKMPFIGEFKIGDFSFVPEQEKLVLLQEDTTLWPNWHFDGVFINRGGIQQFYFQPQGVEGYTLGDYTICVDLPENYTFLGASGHYKYWNLSTETLPVTIGERKYLRNKIKINNPLVFNKKQPQHKYVSVFIRAPEMGENKTDTMFYHSESRTEAILEIPRPLTIHLLPKIDGKAPKQFKLQLWGNWLKNLDDQALLDKILREFVKMGVNECEFITEGMTRVQLLFFFKKWNFDVSDYLKTHSTASLVNQNGEKSADYVCTTEMLSNPDFNAFLEEYTAKWLVRFQKLAHVMVDYEVNVATGGLACYCTRCMKEFGRDDKSGKSDEWTAFMNRRQADLMVKLQAAFKKANPEIIFSIYSGYQGQRTKEFYGLDWALLNGKIDMICCGYGRSLRDLQATKDAAPDTKLLLGEIVFPYQAHLRTRPTYVTKANLLRRAADANGGLLLYCYDSMDGRSFESISVVSRIIADYEDFFRNSKYTPEKVKLPDWPRDDYEVLSGNDGRTLVLLMNPSGHPRKYQLNIAGGDGLSGTIEPHGIAVFCQ